jgi:hypothetical protein
MDLILGIEEEQLRQLGSLDNLGLEVLGVD